MMSQINISTTRIVVAVLAMTIAAFAGTEQMINYQGFLSDAGGEPVTGDRQMVFTIYDAPEDGSILWSSGQVLIHIEEGLFSYNLGQNSPLPPACFADTGRWLGIQIPPDTEIVPRTRLISAPYSFQALNADTAEVGGGWTSGSGKVALCETGDYVGIGVEEPLAKLHVNEDEARLPALDPFYVTYSGQTFFIVKNTGRVGIRTYSPSASLHVRSYHGTEFLIDRDGETHLLVNSDGNIGIGTLLPHSNMHLQSDQIISSSTGIYQADKFIIEGTDAVVGLYSSPAGDYGSCVSLSEVGADGLLEDKWAILRETTNAPLGGGSGLRITYGDLANQANNPTFMRITKNGNVGIGSATPSEHRLYVESDGSGTSGSAARIRNTNDVDGIGMIVENYSNSLTMIVSHHGTNLNDNILRCDSYAGGYHAVFWVKNSGRVICDEIELTGGTDLAEPFEITDGKTLPEGTVVVIDELNPGKLTLSDRPYDTRVAGIISGAGGIKPGVTLTQQNVFDKGQKVAISGRVYCLADASFGTIRPGDLLTTSPTPGHAMKAVDRNRSYGAVIGKAMTDLEKGQGLVLVLVNLQ